MRPRPSIVEDGEGLQEAKRRVRRDRGGGRGSGIMGDWFGQKRGSEKTSAIRCQWRGEPGDLKSVPQVVGMRF